MRARLLEVREVAPRTKHFIFEADAPLDFEPGQFVSMLAEIGGKTVTRAYSIASPPAGNRFELCLNLVDEGAFTPFLFGMNPGEELEFKGPYGVFVFRKPPNDSLLVATGTGITPFRSMLHERLPRERDHQFTLVFGARHESGLLFAEEFRQMEAAYPNFRFIPTLTRPDESWNGRNGRIHAHVLEHLGERRDVDVYICGMAEMINELRSTLKEKGLDRKRIVVEKYD